MASLTRSHAAILLLLACLVLTSACHNRRSTPEDVSPDVEEAPPDIPSPAPGEPTGLSKITAENLATLKRNFRRVNFEFDNAALGEESRALLEENAAILVDHPRVNVRIEGHTDSYGSEDYNLALGQRRAEAVRTYLIDLGVNPKQVALISFGKEKVLVPAGTKEQEALNRRAEFVVATGSDEAISSDDPRLSVTVTVPAPAP